MAKEKSITNSADADEAAQNTISDGSDDATKSCASTAAFSYWKVFEAFIETKTFQDFRERVLADPANYKLLRDGLEKGNPCVGQLLYPSGDPFLDYIIDSIVECGGFAVDKRKKIVRESKEFELYGDKMRNDPANFYMHWDTLEKNDPFVAKLLDNDIVGCLDFMTEYKELAYLHLAEHQIKMHEKSIPDIRKILERIQSKTGCSRDDALWSLMIYQYNEADTIECLLRYQADASKRRPEED